MYSEETRWRPRQKDVAATVLDGEAVMINLARGTYYSMDGVGGAVWELIERGYALAELTEAITRRYRVSAECARRDIVALVDDLLSEDLIAEEDADHPHATRSQVESDERAAYEPPKLHVYRDMADLMVFLEPPTPGEAQEALHFPGGASGGCAHGGNVPDGKASD